MLLRSILVVTSLSIASAAVAQTTVDPQVSADELRQVAVFEASLRTAIEQAASKLGERARATVPDVKLQFEANPYAQGYIMPGGEGVWFVVEVPGIEATSRMLYEAYLKMIEQQQQNPNAPRVGGTTPPTITVPAGSAAEPEKLYAEFARQALVDAILDRAFTLPLKEGQALTISVGDGSPSNQLNPAKRLYLTIKAEDLIALRQNKITRDEARTKIIEKRY